MPSCHGCQGDVTPTTISPTYKKILWVALIVNLGMFLLELASGLKAGSVSLMADSLDFLGDAANYAVSLFVLGMALSIRAKAALLKGSTLGLFGIGVLGLTVHNLITERMPEPVTMGAVAVLALIANVGVAAMLYRWREGDANMQSVWLCSRNDAIGNVAVVIAAGLVAYTSSAWPDLVVAALMAILGITAAKTIIVQAMHELKQSEASQIEPS